jgi:hypothetical protein
MIVLDSDIVTLISYGRTETLHQRIAAVQELGGLNTAP